MDAFVTIKFGKYDFIRKFELKIKFDYEKYKNRLTKPKLSLLHKSGYVTYG